MSTVTAYKTESIKPMNAAASNTDEIKLPSQIQFVGSSNSVSNEGNSCNDNNNTASENNNTQQEQLVVANDTINVFVLTNERLLWIAFASFTTFAVCQMSFSFVAGSDALIGDSSAMMVDSFCYLLNWIAERRKTQFRKQEEFMQYQQDTSDNNPEYLEDGTLRENVVADSDSELQEQRNIALQECKLLERAHRKELLQLEIIPPIFSVTTLLSLTIWVLNDAVKNLTASSAVLSSSQHQTPNLTLMLAFSGTNLGLDVLNMSCFARAKHLLGYKTHGHYHAPKEDDTDNNNSDDDDDSCHQYHGDNVKNLNMCSAYTHVFADTLRSVAVLVAAMIATFVSGVTPDEADAVAAVIVSVLILLSLVPLIHGLILSMLEWHAIRIEERNEALAALSLPSATAAAAPPPQQDSTSSSVIHTTNEEIECPQELPILPSQPKHKANDVETQSDQSKTKFYSLSAGTWSSKTSVELDRSPK